MKNIKKIILVLVIFLFCGCSVKYNLNIDEDLSITEKVEAKETINNLKTNTGMSTDNAVLYLYDIFKRKGIDPNISTKEEKENVITTASVSHKSIEKYVNNFTSDLLKKPKLSKSGNIYSLSYEQIEKLSNSSHNSLIYDDVEINITVPFKVTKHNADRVKKNTYTWKIQKNQELRKINISFDTSKKINSFVLNFGLFKIDVKYNVLVFIILLLMILTTTIIVYINNKKNNKI